MLVENHGAVAVVDVLLTAGIGDGPVEETRVSVGSRSQVEIFLSLRTGSGGAVDEEPWVAIDEDGAVEECHEPARRSTSIAVTCGPS